MENEIAVRLDGSPNSMHHKVIIIDDQIVVAGSYNFSKSVKLATMKIPWLYTAR
jgi:hypothetical protein